MLALLLEIDHGSFSSKLCCNHYFFTIFTSLHLFSIGDQIHHVLRESSVFQRRMKTGIMILSSNQIHQASFLFSKIELSPMTKP